MTDLGRREFLGAVAVAPLTGGALVTDMQRKVGLTGIVPGMSGASGAVASGSGQLRFSNFLKFARHQEPQWRQESSYINCLDPDLASMHLPLATLFRMQKARNYERIKADRKTWFERQMEAAGFVQIWG